MKKRKILKQFIWQKWKFIDGFGSYFKISNLGNIKKIEKYVLFGSKYLWVLEHFLAKTKDKDGYEKVKIFYEGKRKNIFIHRLVAIAFLDNPENKPQITHKDGIKNNNKLKNLEWVINKENVVHSFNVLNRVGSHTGLLGVKNKASKAIIQFSKDGQFIKNWDSMADVYRNLKISTWAISACCKNIKSFNTAGGFIWKYK